MISAYLHRVAESGNLHLRVHQPHYTDDLKERFHRVGSPARWYQELQCWDYPLTAAAIVTLQRIAEEVNIPIEYSVDLKQFAEEQDKVEKYEKQVRLAVEKLMQDKNAPVPTFPTNIPIGLDGNPKGPMRHQMISYHWGLRASGLLLAHDPGLGKTRSACDTIGGWYRENIIRPMQQVWRPEQQRWGVRGGVLVVCPKSMIRTWRDELAMWQSAVGVEISGHKRAVKVEKSGMLAHAHIVNYEILDVVEANEYDAVVLDECHRCANSSGQTSRSLALASKARRRLGLTGTPVSNSLESIFYQMLIIDGGRALGASKTAFLEKYFISETVGPGITQNVPKANALTEVSQAMARCTFFLKKEEAIDLPPKTHTAIKLEMSADQARYYEEVKTEALVQIQDATVTVEQAAAKMMKLRQICQGFVLDNEDQPREFSTTKLDLLADMLSGKLAGRKVVVWATFTHEINRICSMLQRLNMGYVRFDGKTTSKKVRDSMLAYWNSDPRITVFVGQIQMGVGITILANECVVPCYDCIYMSTDWSFTNWQQSQDRIHRIGQKYPCSYTYFLTDGGIDERIYRAILAKAGTSNAVYKTGKEFFRSLLVGDIPDLASLN